MRLSTATVGRLGDSPDAAANRVVVQTQHQGVTRHLVVFAAKSKHKFKVTLVLGAHPGAAPGPLSGFTKRCLKKT